VPAANVDDSRALLEVVRGDDRGGVLLGHAGLVSVEGRRRVGSVSEVREELLTVDTVEGGLARPDTVEQLPARLPPPPFPVQHGRSPQRAGHIALQWLGHWRQRESTGIGLLEYAEAGQSPQHPVKGRRIDSQRRGKLVATLRPPT